MSVPRRASHARQCNKFGSTRARAHSGRVNLCATARVLERPEQLASLRATLSLSLALSFRPPRPTTAIIINHSGAARMRNSFRKKCVRVTSTGPRFILSRTFESSCSVSLVLVVRLLLACAPTSAPADDGGSDDDDHHHHDRLMNASGRPVCVLLVRLPLFTRGR